MDDGFSIGLDLGGTRLKAAAVDRDGAVRAGDVRDARAQESAAAPLAAMVDAVRALCERVGATPRAIGVGVPGAVDPATGIVRGATPHLPHWRDYPLRRELEAVLGRGVVADNDANAAAWGEHRAGAARGARTSLTVTVGTGVGGGIVSGGRLVRGAWGGAGELGHLPLGDGSLPCRCGVPNCVEPEASGSGLVARARAAGLDVRVAREVFDAAAHDPRAAAWIARMGDRLGAAIAVAVTLLNPDVVVIGGGVAQAGETLLAPVRAAVARDALPSHADVRIVPAALGERAGAIGAALLAWEAGEPATGVSRA